MRKVAPKASGKHKKSTKIDPNNLKNDLCEKMIFAIHSMRKPGFETTRRPDFYSKFGTKSVLETSSEKNQIFRPRCQNHVQNRVPKSTQNRYKSDSGPPRAHPAAPMVPQGAPKVPKWSPRVPKWRHQASQITSFGHSQ